jgi:hypothetical protein
MKSFFQYLIESSVNKNTHLEHLEDSIFNMGIPGAKIAVTFLESLKKMLSGNSPKGVNLTVKWDGAPAIVCGKNPENGKFFVATKSAFNKNPKLNYTNSDIDINHEGQTELIQKLKMCLEHLSELNIKNIIQGDLLFTTGDVKSNTFDGEKLITFKPNTITYAVPENSELATKIKSAKMGIVFHTTYSGKTIQSLKASFGADISKLTPTPRVWVVDSSFKDVSGKCTLTKQETQHLSSNIKEIKNFIKMLDADMVKQFLQNEQLKSFIKTYINSKIKSGESISGTKKYATGLVKFVSDKFIEEIELLKTERGKEGKKQKLRDIVSVINSHQDVLISMFMISALISDVKLMLLQKLNEANSIGTFLETSDGFKVTAPEGFVASDRIGNAVKLVDRLEFSKANFTMEKTW